jgi:hypothetical protein
MTVDAVSGRQSAALSLQEKLLLTAIAIFVALRLGFSFAFPVVDETYYWMWGRHLSLSYYDHPPLQGWLQGLSYLVFGRSLFALRWMTWAALAIELWIIFAVTRRLAGEQWRLLFLRSTTIFLASPLFGLFGAVAFHDYLLVLLVMASGYFFICFFADVEEGSAGRSRDLFAGAVLLGLAVLTKYNGAFLGLAVAGTVLARSRLRRLLLDWRLYAAAVVAVALQAPVIAWNVQENFASFAYQLGSRHGTTGFTRIDFEGMGVFALQCLIIVSPFLIPGIVGFFLSRPTMPFERVGKTLAIWAFWLSSLACLFVSNFNWVLFWWNIVAFVLIFPFAGKYLRGALLVGHVVWGLVVTSVLIMTYAVVPVRSLFGVEPGMETERSFDFQKLTDEAVRLKAERGADFIASNHYIVASNLGWVLDDPWIVTLDASHHTFDDWFDPETRRGETAIVVEEPHTERAAWREHFDKITPLGEVRAVQFGYLINTYRLYLGEGFHPAP